MRPFDLDQNELISQFHKFSNLVFSENDNLNKIENIYIPKKEDYVYIYKLFKKIKVFNGNVYDLYLLIFRKISFFKLAAIIKIFTIAKILKRTKESLILINVKTKINLKNQPLFKKLNGNYV